MKILVTGGLGFIGSHTVVELIQSKHDVVIADNLINSKIEVRDKIHQITGVKPIYYQIDVTDEDTGADHDIGHCSKTTRHGCTGFRVHIHVTGNGIQASSSS